MSGSSAASSSTRADSCRPDASADDKESLRDTRNDAADAGATGRDASDRHEALSQTAAPTTGFRFLDLPAELRYRVYSLLLPTNLNIKFKRLSSRHIYAYVSSTRRTRLTFEKHLFRVNKFVSNEAKSVLYGMNTFWFTIDGRSLRPRSLRSPSIFGLLGHARRLALLRNLRRIHIRVIPDIDSHWAVKRQRARLEYLVEILKEHADDDNQKSLLQDLTVEFKLSSGARSTQTSSATQGTHAPSPQPPTQIEKFMFGLESLAALRGIRDVKIVGLPEWYARCLQLCIQGKGGQVQQIDWPRVQVKRRAGGGRRGKKTRWVTTRKWHQPMLNWLEFAERNNIAVPDGISVFGEAAL